jgi:hypothetical protein
VRTAWCRRLEFARILRLWRGHFVLSSRVLPLSGETNQVPDISKWLRYNAQTLACFGQTVEGVDASGWTLRNAAEIVPRFTVGASSFNRAPKEAAARGTATWDVPASVGSAFASKHTSHQSLPNGARQDIEMLSGSLFWCVVKRSNGSRKHRSYFDANPKRLPSRGGMLSGRTWRPLRN